MFKKVVVESNTTQISLKVSDYKIKCILDQFV